MNSTPPSKPDASLVESPQRRRFVKTAATTAALAWTAASRDRVYGANNRIGLGFVGYGLIGKRHVIDFKERADVNMAAIAEVHHGRLDEAASFIGGPVKAYKDFRRMLENPDVDAVCVSTADHWHALITMMACAAGKDVYVEKPLTLFVREGRWMADVARRHKRIVQVGTQQRSGPHYQRARDLIRKGHLGKISSVRVSGARNIMPGYGAPADRSPPPYLDWEMMLGPAPYRPYNLNRSIYHFRWFWDSSGGQMTNLGQHSLDIVFWFLGVKGLAAVTSIGGRYSLKDNGETPDTQEALFEFPDWTLSWSHREASRGDGGRGLRFYGHKGSLRIGRGGFETAADRKVVPANTVPQFTGAHPAGGPPRVKEADPPEYWTEPLKDATGDSRTQFKLHVANFLDSIRSRRQPISDLESGHRVVSACHLANISLRLEGRRLVWDAEKEDIVNDAEASSMLARPYRKPWDRELRALEVG